MVATNPPEECKVFKQEIHGRNEQFNLPALLAEKNMGCEFSIFSLTNT